MAGTGAGPSRRSHTKSRKGCKTCKRRHIRCDETFPQCRNCTKHQVRCDYMETIDAEDDNQHHVQQPVVVLSPEFESRVDLWQRTGSFPFPNLHVFPTPPTHEYSTNELRLLYHLANICNELLLKRVTGATLWTEKMPKFLSIASTYPYVMHALLAFSANHLSWQSSAKEIKNLSFHHANIALRGLHEAIGSFSHANADAVLATSLLLLWQATDWRSWSSLRAGIQSVLSTMHSQKHESIFTEYISQDDLFASSLRVHRRRSSVDPVEGGVMLQNIVGSLQALQMSQGAQDFELDGVNQLIAYLHRLQTVNLPQTPEEQFNNLYQLRKWLLWTPTALLQSQDGQGAALITTAHYYAVALAVEPLFPDLGQAFVSGMALGSLETIINITNAMQVERGASVASSEVAILMQFPRQIAMKYRAHAANNIRFAAQEPGMFSVDAEALTYTTMGNLSPAFVPSPLHNSEHQTPSSSHSSFLEVPGTQNSFAYGPQSWGAVPSPNFAPQSFTNEVGQEYGYSDLSLNTFRGGFVAATPIWT